MLTAVITGSTKGIGRGLAEEFVKRGHNAVICSRSIADVERVAVELTAMGAGKCSGVACDISDKQQLQALWNHARLTYGQVDIWINNAGRASSRHQVHDLPEDLTRSLITSNLLGTTFGSQVAVSGFREQGSGTLYNVLGGSFDGKRLVPNISPGMLITENWFDEQAEMSDADWQKIKPMLNILCDYVDTVTPWLTDQVLANKESGKRITWLSGGKIAKRFIDAKLLGRKRDLFARYGL